MRPDFVLTDIPEDWKFLFPLTYFREISNIRIGILTIREKWEKYLQAKASVAGTAYLSKDSVRSGMFVRASVLPDRVLARLILRLKEDECLFDSEGDWMACRLSDAVQKDVFLSLLTNNRLKKVTWEKKAVKLFRPWDLIRYNEEEIRKDFDLLGLNNRILGDVQIRGGNPVYIAPGARLDAVFIDASEGPVFIDEHVNILPFSFIKGPAAILHNVVVKAGTKIYNGTTLGPWTKAGGELKNVLFFGYANKAHDGYLGDSVIGEWCNIGAGSSHSNLKNNYSPVRMWHIAQGKYEDTGAMFMGTVMGDYSKLAINSRVNSGTVIGVSSNIFTPGFPPKFVNSFNWGGAKLQFNYDLEKAIQTARIMWQRRNKTFDAQQRELFEKVRAYARKAEQW